ncbi:mediator of RNA polymerase II transcription subunit 30-like [Ptychodera flava]|uniref:mediator of RNA polymerase II transcription subunit 30-like n=1 Tax=Ptychodera flava TaxID=63121 RepID=UPI00396A80E7
MASHGHQTASGGGAGGSGATPREVNTASLCRIGQETVQDIVAKTTEIFSLLKNTQLPNGVPPATTNHQERQTKLQENMKNLVVLFKKLRLVYEKCNENCTGSGMDNSNPEELIPWMDEGAESKVDLIMPNTDKLYFVKEEHKEMLEKIQAKNHQLKEIMDQLRSLMWDLNTMLVMTRTAGTPSH